ncbi:MAG: glycosyltransferase family 39 protein [Patescibacteria group bacterium]|jgi:hypothetical protein
MHLNRYIKYVPIFLLLSSALLLRICDLGYSDYQGDEIKALFIPDPGQSVSEFLLTQRKGPVQFFVTFLLKLLDPMYAHRFWMRVPFALAGTLSVLIFYKLLCLHYNKRVALFSSLFFSFNGFFVAFSRIIQYQSFVILFMLISLYFFSLSIKEKKWEIKGLYAGFIFWALSILSHYDGIFIFPFAAYLLFIWLSDHRKSLKHLFLSAAIFLTLLLVFYVPFALSITPGTSSYWHGRLVGTGGKISSSTYLFSVYQPIYVIHFYILFGIIGGVLVLFESLLQTFLHKITNKTGRIANFLTKMEVNTSSGTGLLKNLGLLLWFFIPFLFLEVVVTLPGTHIYSYLIPVFIFLGLSLNTIERFFCKVLKSLSLRIVYTILTCVFFVFLFLQSYTIYANHKEEYPWEQEYFLLWELPKPNHLYHLSMFGFPYFRNWDEIGNLIRTTAPAGTYYSTNERESIARYHIDLLKDTDLAGYYVYIRNPQSFTDEKISEKALYWIERYGPVFTFIKDGKEIASVYNMEPGKVEDLILKGF